MTTTTINPDCTWIVSNYPTNNYYTNATLQVGESNSAASNARSILKPDLSSIPINALVSSAKVRIYAITDQSSNVRSMRAYRIKRSVELDECTWDVYSTGNNWQTAGGFGADDCEQTDIGYRDFTASETLNEYKEIDLDTDAIQEMISGTFTNNGILLKMDTENSDQYRFGSDDAASNKPELVIIYTVPSGNFFMFF